MPKTPPKQADRTVYVAWSPEAANLVVDAVRFFIEQGRATTDEKEAMLLAAVRDIEDHHG